MNTPAESTTLSQNDRRAIGDFRLRGLTCVRTGQEDDAWRATLLCEDRRIARLESDHRQGPVRMVFSSAIHRLLVIKAALAWHQEHESLGDLPTTDTAIEQILELFVLDLAERAYHYRHLQMQSRLHTLFRLRGDPSDRFRTVRNQPYSMAREGQLRLIYGRRLVEIVRRCDTA